MKIQRPLAYIKVVISALAIVACTHTESAPIATTTTKPPPAVIAPAIAPVPTYTWTSPTGKFAAYEIKFHVTIHDQFDQFSASYAYTRCLNQTAEIFVSPVAPADWVDGLLKHEYGHVLECHAGWGDRVNSPTGESVADAVGITLGGYATYGVRPSDSDFATAKELLK